MTSSWFSSSCRHARVGDVDDRTHRVAFLLRDDVASADAHLLIGDDEERVERIHHRENLSTEVEHVPNALEREPVPEHARHELEPHHVKLVVLAARAVPGAWDDRRNETR